MKVPAKNASALSTPEEKTSGKIVKEDPGKGLLGGEDARNAERSQ